MNLKQRDAELKAAQQECEAFAARLRSMDEQEEEAHPQLTTGGHMKSAPHHRSSATSPGAQSRRPSTPEGGLGLGPLPLWAGPRVSASEAPSSTSLAPWALTAGGWVSDSDKMESAASADTPTTAATTAAASSRSPAMRNGTPTGFSLLHSDTSSPVRRHASTASLCELRQQSPRCASGNVGALEKLSPRENEKSCAPAEMPQRQQFQAQGHRDASPIVARNEISATQVFNDMLGGLVRTRTEWWTACLVRSDALETAAAGTWSRSVSHSPGVRSPFQAARSPRAHSPGVALRGTYPPYRLKPQRPHGPASSSED